MKLRLFALLIIFTLLTLLGETIDAVTFAWGGPNNRQLLTGQTLRTNPANIFTCADVTEIPEIECEALVALYHSANGANWENDDGWLTTNTPCAWFSVRCGDGNVTWLLLFGNQLSGSIPPELGNLEYLQYLSLGSNQLSGSIPPELGNLENLLELSLGSNLLSGSIPPELGNLENLLELSLSINQLSSNIPPELGNLASLQSLSLNSNQLSGSIPPELGNLASLQSLSLNSNQLSGSIPPELGNLASLQSLSLNSNQLSGSIPPELGNLASLWRFSLNSNQLSGSIPPELGNLHNLQTLNLDSNQLSGSIPPELGNLHNLHWLILRDNQLSSSIPLTFVNLNNLSYFWFNNTGLCEPADEAFQHWLANVPYVQSTGVLCDPIVPPQCDGANTARQPVLLVHGWGGPDVLAEDGSGFAQMYKWMVVDGYVEGCNLFYATGVTSTKTREQNRQAIQRNLRSAYTQLLQSNSQWRGHFDIIGHSYGGLNARFYLESDYYQQDRSYGQYGIHVDNLFTLGSPHGGTRVPQEMYAGAAMIAGKHIFAPFNLADFLSAAQLHSTAMDLYNFSHIQPTITRYHLLGGDFLKQVNVPFTVRAMYSPWLGYPGDIGVSLRSSRQLGVNPLLQFHYPRVCIVTNEDMHGYENRLGLGSLNSYVHPAVTYNMYILDTLGTQSTNCPANALTYADYSLVTVEDEMPFVSPVLLDSGVLTDGQTAAADFPVDWSGKSVFYVSWSGGDVDFTLVDGLGQAITPALAQTDPSIDYEKLADAEGGLATYVLTNTVTGPWSYIVSAGSGPYPITYTVYAIADTVLTVEAFAPEWQSFGTPVALTAAVTAAGTPVTGAAVMATVTLPDGSQVVLPLHDDGVDPDAVADDGIYVGWLQQTDQSGFYLVSVVATGSHESHNYRRTTDTVFSIASAGAALSSIYSDRGVDDTSDGIYEWLEVTAQIAVTEAATYALSADLYAGETFITHVRKQTYLSPGQHSVALQFQGQSIFEHGINGPYTIRNVLLLEESAVTLLVETADNVYVTQAYRYTDFGRHMIYLPLVVRR